PLERAPETVGPVRQRAEMATVGDDAPEWEALAPLIARLRELVGDPRWHPNEATVMSYADARDGITPHRDQRRYLYAIAVLSVDGEARLEVYDDARRRVLGGWRCRPGDVVVLRGPDPAAAPDAGEVRPMHALSSPSGTGRSSLTLRMDARRRRG
ncbi:MAG: hypothetical protein M3296_02310, partial [Actinomycetota bacterium]|nr:hypothetical protein [Actinomycetota bacterium]